MYTFLILEKTNAIATLSLNRPERYNALNKGLCEEIASAIQDLSKDESTNVIRLKGLGKGFCAGLDLFEVDIEELKQAGKIVRELFNPIVFAIKNSPKPVVAEVSGVAAGAGCSLALACDIVFASHKALFSLPFLKISLLPDTGASYFIVKQLGYKKAFEMFAGNKSLTALEAESCGLINRTCDENTLEEQCMAYCIGLSQLNPESTKALKQLLQSAETKTLSETLDLEAYYQDKAAKSPAFEAAITLFKALK